jgi:hypothetical protein
VASGFSSEIHIANGFGRGVVVVMSSGFPIICFGIGFIRSSLIVSLLSAKTFDT